MTERPNEEFLSPLMPFPVDTAKDTFRRFVPVLIAEAALTALMLGVYALAGRWSAKVLLGALLGAGLAIANFSAMVLSFLRGERTQDPEKLRLFARGGTFLRLIVLFGLLFCALKFWALDPLATLLPLVLMRIALFAAAFGGKEEKKS